MATAIKSLNTLICENRGVNQQIASRSLSLAGHKVTLVEGGDAMLGALESQRFDLVITGLNMTDMSGIEAVKVYRFTQPSDKHTKFILFTSDDTLATRQEAYNAAFDGFLKKPIDTNVLFSTIESVLGLPANTVNNSKINLQSNTLTTTDHLLDYASIENLEAIGAGDDLFVYRLLKNYLTESIDMIKRIEHAAENKQHNELQYLCLALKGNSLSVGANKLASLSDQISLLDTEADMLQGLNQLNQTFAELTLAVENYLKKPEAKTK